MADEFLQVEVDVKSVEDALADAGPKLARRAIKQALNAAGDVLQSAMKAKAPIATKGTLQRTPGELRNSIGYRITLSAKKESGLLRVGPLHQANENHDPAVYAVFVEYGSVHNPAPVPFARQTKDGSMPEAELALEAVLKSVVETFSS